MNNKLAGNIFIASSLSGLTYWLIVFGRYLFEAILSGQIPFDALLIFVPILVFSWGAGLLLCLPVYKLFGKFFNVSNFMVLFLSVMIAIIYAMVITRQFSDITMYVGSVMSGLTGGMLFLYLEKKCSVITGSN